MDARVAVATLGLLVLLCPSAALGQSMPVTAKERITDEVVQNGKVIAGGHTREGVWFRNSAGSVLAQWTTIDGKPAVGQMARARLADNEHGVHYELDYTERQAYIDSVPKTTITGNGRTRAQNALGQGSVEGIACTWFPVYQVGSDGVSSLVGRHCFSEQYELDLKEDSTLTYPIKGQPAWIKHLVIEKYDIQIGQEPDPKLFDIKTNFTVNRPDPKE
jgi:hypothetical protein